MRLRKVAIREWEQMTERYFIKMATNEGFILKRMQCIAQRVRFRSQPYLSCFFGPAFWLSCTLKSSWRRVCADSTEALKAKIRRPWLSLFDSVIRKGLVTTLFWLNEIHLNTILWAAFSWKPSSLLGAFNSFFFSLFLFTIFFTQTVWVTLKCEANKSAQEWETR